MEALGILETRGLTASISATDTMLKAAEVAVIGTEKIGSGLVTVLITGDVGAVTASISAGKDAAEQIGGLVAFYVIPRPHNDLAKILPLFD